MSRRRDAALAALVGGAGLGVALAPGNGLDGAVAGAPVAAAVGAAGALAAEALTQLRPAAVRRAWERPRVRAVVTAGALVATGGAARLVGPAVGWVVAGGAGAYLVLLAAVVALERARGTGAGE